ncbi:hypothetical protein PIB30_098754, partial [Stylosanthes scabra]|nr:hypothetical protein [Stylosanthes scabra]
MFPVAPPPTPQKKSVHHFHVCREEAQKINVMKKAKEKGGECRKEENKSVKGSRVAPPPLKKKEKKEGLKPAKKKKKHEEVKSRKKKCKEDEDEERIASKCSRLGNLLGKLKKIGKALRHNQKMDAHLVKDQSKW